ncbi:MAG: hypothetical protein HQL44_01670 [Alphaproteobacteria bacterium]|nr:hypothetical protein [Alphaproteobacteria bacterium]
MWAADHWTCCLQGSNRAMRLVENGWRSASLLCAFKY